MIKVKILPILVLAFAATAVSPSWAHGSQHHGKPSGELTFEQKDWGIGAAPSKASRTIGISALISEINMLSFKILKIFWLNKTQNIKAAIGMNLANSYLFIGQKIVLILL